MDNLIDAPGWRPFDTAPRGAGVALLVKFKDVPPADPSNESHLAGVQAVLVHQGFTDEGADRGWKFTGPLAYAAHWDDWVLGWKPLDGVGPGLNDGLDPAAVLAMAERHLVGLYKALLPQHTIANVNTCAEADDMVLLLRRALRGRLAATGGDLDDLT